MDNASKALIMAGGILITVMVIGLSLYLLSSARGFAKTSNAQAELSAIESFNRYYLSFGSSGVKISGIDALNLYNKAIDDRDRTNSMHQIEIDVRNELIEELDAPNGIIHMSGDNYTYKYKIGADGYVNYIEIVK